MSGFLLDLEREADLLAQLGTIAKRRDDVSFPEFWWEAEEDLIQQMIQFRDGCLFETKTRMFALGRLHNELRYWAGRLPVRETELDSSSEYGMFRNMHDALEFALDYFNGQPLSEITVQRGICRSDWS